jgi:hypothetical protein
MQNERGKTHILKTLKE